jgi:hypothetical protein
VVVSFKSLGLSIALVREKKPEAYVRVVANLLPMELVLGAVGRNVSTLDYHPVWGVEDMKKRGLRSPDLADAFLLTFACNETRKMQTYRRRVRRCSAWAA